MLYTVDYNLNRRAAYSILVTSKSCTDGVDSMLTRGARAHKHKFMNVPTHVRNMRVSKAVL